MNCPICHGTKSIQVRDQNGTAWDTYCVFCGGSGIRNDDKLEQFGIPDIQDSNCTITTES